MMSLLVLKEQLKLIYSRYGTYIVPAFKCFFSMTIFYLLNRNIGFMTEIKHPLVVVLLGVICSILPYGSIAVFVAVFMTLHLSAISFELGFITIVFLLAIMLLYYGFRPGDSYLLLLTPLLFCFKIPYLIPLLVGLSGSLISIIPVSCGVFIYYTLLYVKQNAGVLTSETSSDTIQKYIQVVKALLGNETMLLMMVAFVMGILVVYMIKNQSIDYSWVIAIISGTVAQLVVIFIGDMVFDLPISIFWLIFGVVCSVLLAGIYHFMEFAVDYSRTEHTQFEDDDYYYYVKAVPKIMITTPDIKVQRINSRRVQKNSYED